MRRRALVGLLGAAVTAPRIGRAQSSPPIIGYLGGETAQRFATRLAAFKAGLASTGLTVSPRLLSRADEVIE